MSTKTTTYRRVDRLRTRQRDSAQFKTVENIFTRSGMNGGSQGVAYADTDSDDLADKITKTNRAQALKPPTS